MNSPAESDNAARKRAAEQAHAEEHGYVEHLATNLYYDRHFESQAAKVLPGEYYVTRRDMVLVTVLGSCVTACIRDSDSGIGGMNHFPFYWVT